MVKYFELLEATDNIYLPMFNKVFSLLEKSLPQYDYNQLKHRIIDQISKTKAKYKRKDIIEFYIKLYRNEFNNYLAKHFPEVDIQPVKQFYEKTFPDMPTQNLFTMEIIIDHYISMMDNEPYKSYRFDNKTIEQVYNDINEMDKLTKNTSNTIDMSKDTKAYKIISFPDGSAWFNLNRPSCEVEGRAMGHCGNEENSHSYDTVLSYRTPNDDGTWTPHLTFILNTANNMLGEMKGRANTKPIPKYHPYIIALLKSEYVEGIIGGGYKPENNFSLSDLPKEQRESLIEMKPKLLNLYELYTHFDGKINDAIMETFNQIMREYHIYIYKSDDKYYINYETSYDKWFIKNIKSDYTNKAWTTFGLSLIDGYSYDLFDSYLKSGNKLPEKINEYALYKDKQNYKDFGLRKTISILLRDYDNGIMYILRYLKKQTSLSFIASHINDDLGKVKVKHGMIVCNIDAEKIFKKLNDILKQDKRMILEELKYIIPSLLNIDMTKEDLAKYVYGLFNSEEIKDFLNDKSRWD